MGNSFPLPPTLVWRTEGTGARFVGTHTIKPGKDLRLTGEGYPNPDLQQFTVVRWLHPLLHAWRRHRGEQPYVKFADALGVGVANPYLRAHAAQSDPLRLPGPGLRIRRSYSYFDQHGNWSNLLRIASFGTVTLKGPTLSVPGVDLVGIEGSFTAAVDPPLRFDLLLPWEPEHSQTGGLRGYLRDLADDLAKATEGDPDQLLAQLWTGLEEAELVPAAPPDGWTLSIVPTAMEATPGQVVPFQVLLQAPTSGAFALAVQVGDVQTEMAAASEVVVLRWNASYQDGYVEFAAEPTLL